MSSIASATAKGPVGPQNFHPSNEPLPLENTVKSSVGASNKIAAIRERISQLPQSIKTSAHAAKNYAKTHPIKALIFSAAALAVLKYCCGFQARRTEILFRFSGNANEFVHVCRNGVCELMHPCSPVVTSSPLTYLFMRPEWLPCVMAK